MGYNEMFPTVPGGTVGDRYRGEQGKSRGEHPVPWGTSSTVGDYVTPVETRVTPVGTHVTPVGTYKVPWVTMVSRGYRGYEL